MRKERYTLETLKEYVIYKDGALYWNKSRPRATIGKACGAEQKGTGYITFCLMGHNTMLHRAIFFYHNGFWPEVVDHKDRNTRNNKIENLRACSTAENRRNSKGKISKSKYKGVSIFRGKYCAKITVLGKRTVIGFFTDENEAALEYNKKAKELHGEFAFINDVV